MSPVWGNDSTHPVRRQGNELLCPMPDGWKSTGGSRPVPPSRGGLATDFGGVGIGHSTRTLGISPEKIAANAFRDFWRLPDLGASGPQHWSRGGLPPIAAGQAAELTAILPAKVLRRG